MTQFSLRWKILKQPLSSNQTSFVAQLIVYDFPPHASSFLFIFIRVNESWRVNFSHLKWIQFRYLISSFLVVRKIWGGKVVQMPSGYLVNRELGCAMKGLGNLLLIHSLHNPSQRMSIVSRDSGKKVLKLIINKYPWAGSVSKYLWASTSRHI